MRDALNRVVARGSTTVHVAHPQAGTKGFATLLMMGASLTERSVYPKQVLDLSIRDPYVLLKFVGSRGPNNLPPTGELRHEGYSGWTAEAFVTREGPLSERTSVIRPFITMALFYSHQVFSGASTRGIGFPLRLLTNSRIIYQLT